MTPLAEQFIRGLGRPAPATRNAIHFQEEFVNMLWESVAPDVGAGWFLDRFVYLFGPGLERLHRCLDAWPALVPPNHPDRMVLGYNVHGAILVLENGNSAVPQVYLLEPYVGAYWTHEDIAFENLLGMWLPERRLPYFLDTGVYEAWRGLTDRYLPEDTILAPKVPRDLGGERTLENFQVEDLFEFHESAGAIHAKAAARVKHPGPRGRKR
jgi:hypothetical protein